MTATRAVRHSDVQRVGLQWGSTLDLRAQVKLPTKLFMESSTLGENVLKLGAILDAMALSFFGMRFWVFLGMRLSPDLPGKVRSLPSSQEKDRASKSNHEQSE